MSVGIAREEEKKVKAKREILKCKSAEAGPKGPARGLSVHPGLELGTWHRSLGLRPPYRVISGRGAGEGLPVSPPYTASMSAGGTASSHATDLLKLLGQNIRMFCEAFPFYLVRVPAAS